MDTQHEETLDLELEVERLEETVRNLDKIIEKKDREIAELRRKLSEEHERCLEAEALYIRERASAKDLLKRFREFEHRAYSAENELSALKNALRLIGEATRD